MQKLITRTWRRLYSFAAERVVHQYIKKDRAYTYKGLQLTVYKNVFHPGLFRSTKVFARWLEKQPLAGTTVLELGCGSGLLSLVAAGKGASVYAVDINPRAVENANHNAIRNQINITAFRSDLFSSVGDLKFSMVLVNPPFFPKTAGTDYDHAWFCGEHYEYFEKLFGQLKPRLQKEQCYIILSDSCDLEKIQEMATKHGCAFTIIYQEIVSGETLTIYRADRTANDYFS